MRVSGICRYRRLVVNVTKNIIIWKKFQNTNIEKIQTENQVSSKSSELTLSFIKSKGASCKDRLPGGREHKTATSPYIMRLGFSHFGSL